MTRPVLEVEIRKLRKKLRQIENLEQLERDLSDEEYTKLSNKSKIREKLQSLLVLTEENPDIWNDYNLHQKDIDVSFGSSVMTSTSNNTSIQDTSLLSLSHDNDLIMNDEVEEYAEVSSSDMAVVSEDFSKESENDWTIKGHIPQALPQKSPRKRPVNEYRENQYDDEGPKKTKQQQISQKPESNINCLVKSSSKQHSKKDSKKTSKSQVLRVRSYEGHNDIVTAVDSDAINIVSGSRDTTLRYWDVRTGKEQKCFGGHSGTVTAVVLLSQKHTQEFCNKYSEDLEFPLDDNEKLAITGSTDCSIRIWALESGQLLKNIYTFNPITCVQYIPHDQVIVVSTAGGKIDIWDPLSGQNIFSSVIHKDGITSLKVVNNLVYSSSSDGEIQVHEYKISNSNENRHINLKCLYVSKNTKLSPGCGDGNVQSRHINCVAVYSEHNIYYGDDGSNVKMLNWKEGEVNKLANHLHEFGSTDAVVIHSDILYASGYDLDHGLGYINCRNATTGKYMYTLCDEISGRILCLCVPQSSAGRVIITGGTDLRVWTEEYTDKRQSSKEENQVDAVQPYYIKQYEKDAKHSDIESDDDSDADSSSEPLSPFKRKTHGDDQEQLNNSNTTSWMSWCAIL